MSYLRGPIYVWSDGHHMHVWLHEPDEAEDRYVADCDFPRGIAVPTDVWDALCLMRAAQIAQRRGGERYTRRLLARYGGNIGSAALYEQMGQVPPWRAAEPEQED
jgi:hypothetical protein